MSARGATRSGRMQRRVLVVDVGGTHVKVLATGAEERRRFDSEPDLTARAMVSRVLALTRDWDFDVVSIGYPGPVLHGKPLAEPHNLGGGWVGFDFEHAFGCQVKVVNDAAMQALGSYEGGRMLFLGLGTGLGTALVVDGRVEPMEIAHLPYRKGRSYEEWVGERGRKRLGGKRWRKAVADVAQRLAQALEAEYVVLGGGNAKKLRALPEGCRLGDNANAFTGGMRLWQAPPAARGRRR